MYNLNGINFWSDLKSESAFLDGDDEVIERLPFVFDSDGQDWHPAVVEAMKRHGFSLTETFVLTHDTIEDAIMTLNVSRSLNDMPIKCDKNQFDVWLETRLNQIRKKY